GLKEVNGNHVAPLGDGPPAGRNAKLGGRLRNTRKPSATAHRSQQNVAEGSHARPLSVSKHWAVHDRLRVDIEAGLCTVVRAEIQVPAEPAIEVFPHRQVESVHIDASAAYVGHEVRVAAKHLSLGGFLRPRGHTQQWSQ